MLSLGCTDIMFFSSSCVYHTLLANGVPRSSVGTHDTGRASDGGRATLLLLDRADDPLSPLMHEFTYQCLVEDLLGIQVILIRDIYEWLGPRMYKSGARLSFQYQIEYFRAL